MYILYTSSLIKKRVRDNPDHPDHPAETGHFCPDLTPDLVRTIPDLVGVLR